MWKTKRSFVALFAGVALLLAISAIYLVLRPADDEEPGGFSAFHYVASIEIDLPSDPNASGPVNRIEAWYKEGAGGRWDLSYNDSARASEGKQIFVNENGMLNYDGETNIYITYPAQESSRDYAASIPFSFFLGPMPAPDLETFFDDFVSGQPDTTWTVRGEEEMLGLTTKVVDVKGPGGQRATYWVEPENVFILRHETISNTGQRSSGRITELEIGPKLDDGLFIFNPPANALKEEPNDTSTGMSSSTLGGSAFPRQEGFLVPSYLPPGYVSRGSGGQQSNNRMTNYHVTLAPSHDGPVALLVDQQFRAGGLAAPPQNSTTIDVAGRAAYRTSSGGEETLTIGIDDVIVTLRSATLPFDELIRIAASMN